MAVPVPLRATTGSSLNTPSANVAVASTVSTVRPAGRQVGQVVLAVQADAGQAQARGDHPPVGRRQLPLDRPLGHAGGLGQHVQGQAPGGQVQLGRAVVVGVVDPQVPGGLEQGEVGRVHARPTTCDGRGRASAASGPFSVLGGWTVFTSPARPMSMSPIGRPNTTSSDVRKSPVVVRYGWKRAWCGRTGAVVGPWSAGGRGGRPGGRGDGGGDDRVGAGPGRRPGGGPGVGGGGGQGLDMAGVPSAAWRRRRRRPRRPAGRSRTAGRPP